MSQEQDKLIDELMKQLEIINSYCEQAGHISSSHEMDSVAQAADRMSKLIADFNANRKTKE